MKKLRTAAPILAMILIAVVIGGILVSVMGSTSTLVADILYNQAQSANQAFAYTFEEYQKQAIERAEMIAASGDIVRAVEDRDTDALRAALKGFSQGVDLITLCDAEGTVLARTHSDKTGDSVLSQAAITAALTTGKGIRTIEPGTVIGLSTRGSAAIKDENGVIIGALTCGHDLSQSKYIDAVKAQNNCEATFFSGDERMSTTLVDEKGDRALGSKANDDVVQTVLNEKKDYTGRVTLFGSTYEVYYSPVVIDGQALGMLFTGVCIDTEIARERQLTVWLLTAAVMLALALLITYLLIRGSSRKTHWYEQILDSLPFPLSVTDMDMKWTFVNKPVEQMLGVSRQAMLGKHCSNWGAGICNTENCGITCLRAGKTHTFFEQMGLDFRVDLSYLYDAKGKKDGHIEVVQDISEMVKTQKQQTVLIGKIREASDTFVAGSKQVADGAHTLAKDATEQAAVIEQLSSSLEDISEKTASNAQMAGQAARLAEQIKGNAEKGSRQMDQMMTAVQEINQASQEIGKVIKVIDDIAFQTNILALNAAVEAARAGQHGKGFAVVAEEVRNLAAKSAGAAKDTGGLIVNSMEKAALGAQIADETAASLIQIVSGIQESTRLVGDIAKLSQEQTAGITQINHGVNQVAHVIQQTSATAEESAAASEEMSQQAGLLEDLVMQISLDSGQEAAPKRLTQG